MIFTINTLFFINFCRTEIKQHFTAIQVEDCYNEATDSIKVLNIDTSLNKNKKYHLKYIENKEESNSFAGSKDFDFERKKLCSKSNSSQNMDLKLIKKTFSKEALELDKIINSILPEPNDKLGNLISKNYEKLAEKVIWLIKKIEENVKKQNLEFLNNSVDSLVNELTMRSKNDIKLFSDYLFQSNTDLSQAVADKISNIKVGIDSALGFNQEGIIASITDSNNALLVLLTSAFSNPNLSTDLFSTIQNSFSNTLNSSEAIYNNLNTAVSQVINEALTDIISLIETNTPPVQLSSPINFSSPSNYLDVYLNCMSWFSFIHKQAEEMGIQYEKIKTYMKTDAKKLMKDVSKYIGIDNKFVKDAIHDVNKRILKNISDTLEYAINAFIDT